MLTKGCLFFALLVGTLSFAQSPPPNRVEFEVAAVRPTSTPTRGIRIDGAQVHFTGFFLREYIARAYQVRVTQIIGPDWLSSTKFDIDAKIPAGGRPTQAAEMLQALLVDRFSLKQHRTQEELPVYALVMGKPPLRLKESAPDPEASPRIEALVNVTVTSSNSATVVDLGHGSSYTNGNGKFEGKRLTAEMIASVLERYCDRPVVNMTGLTGSYDFSFDVTPEEAQVLGIRAALYAGVVLPPDVLRILDTGGNPLMDAMRQLGLKLEARTAPVDVLVVDSARPTPIEN